MLGCYKVEEFRGEKTNEDITQWSVARERQCTSPSSYVYLNECHGYMCFCSCACGNGLDSCFLLCGACSLFPWTWVTQVKIKDCVHPLPYYVIFRFRFNLFIISFLKNLPNEANRNSLYMPQENWANFSVYICRLEFIRHSTSRALTTWDVVGKKN